MDNRPRRNRKSKAIREMITETKVGVKNLIYPIFLVDGDNTKDEIHSLPGNYRWSLDLLYGEIENCLNLGLKSFILFPKIDERKKVSERI